MSGVVLTAGSVLRGDDAAGPMLAKLLEEQPVEGWCVVDGGQTPEDDLAVVRRAAPDRILFVDAAQMELKPGEIRRLRAEDVATQFLITTPSLPTTFLLGELDRICDNVTFVGIQLRSTEFFDPLSPEVRAALDDVMGCLRDGGDFTRYAAMGD